jgi:hypothetical protein
MGIKKAEAVHEILELLGEITARIEQLEETMDETLNTERCRLWGNQIAKVHSVQEAFDKVEQEWMVKEMEDKAFILRKDSAMNKKLPMNPKLGF